MTNEPISQLDERLDALVKAIGQVPDLPALIDGLRGYERLVGLLAVDAPGAVVALGVAPVWSALGDVASEVLTIREGAS